MARQKEIINQELVFEAQKRLRELEQHRTYLRLFAVIKSGEHPIIEVAKFFGVSRDTIYRWIKMFHAQGVEGLCDRPKGHNPSKLNEEHKQQIASWLETGKNARGEPVHWTLEKLRLEITKEFGISISGMPLLTHLRKMGFQKSNTWEICCSRMRDRALIALICAGCTDTTCGRREQSRRVARDHPGEAWRISSS